MTRALVVGGGLAGLVTALRLAPRPTTVISAGPLGDGTSTGWAQGGIAAALGSDDSAALHAADTLAAGAGLCDPAVVERVTGAAPEAVRFLERLGARFDRASDSTLRLGLEAAHRRHRIVHAGGDGTGAEILAAVVAAVLAEPAITVLEGARARRVLVEDGRVVGLLTEHHGKLLSLPADAVVLATGGVGGLWAHTTNPRGSRGQGLALAARAGAVLRDLEMVQFHPTALDVGLDPMPLVSEAVRGAGALLVDAAGRPFTDPLAPRDVVSRAVWAHLSTGAQPYLDARSAIGRSFAARFPTVARACRAAAIDPAHDLVPVRPAVHYHCGGIAVDGRGRSTVPGLWAVGEVASTGLHGANRLASNSLLEAVVCAGWAAEDILGTATEAPSLSPAARPATAPTSDLPALGRVRSLLDRAAGVLRDGDTLAAAESVLAPAVEADPELVDDATLVAFLVLHACRAREESRGAHTRTDAPVAVHVPSSGHVRSSGPGPARASSHQSAPEAVHTELTLADALTSPPVPDLVLTGAAR
ncbi:L-aspartate oxidase [Ornithinimicrobium tianjinense]|uniref:L-aspartate oxidase n=1 Tax=Ornithinimicrobium tianjinense TaxID=1195761 RepID=A0A917F3N0_9MICO|nr:L-aspartate oxidase [Ornithinimicrobium tianjinense]GGF50085.1 L-aspartate oxidase [Ornithinimicrobium tianjinense]